MGNCCAVAAKVYTEIDLQSQKIDQQLLADQKRDALKYKILVLGTGESGKSTFVNQMLHLENQQFSPKDIESYIYALRSNVLESLHHYIVKSKELHLVFTPREYEARELIEIAYRDLQDKVPPPSIVEEIMHLWKSNFIQFLHRIKDLPASALSAEEVELKKLQDEKVENSGTIEKMKERYWNLDAVDYYMANAKRIFDPNFAPVIEDIIMARKRTTSILTSKLTYKNITWNIVDVGGQVSERRKWIHQFSEVQAIIYVINLADYTNEMFEVEGKNRMHDSLECFDEICHNAIFLETPIYLFFNKRDLFENKIKKGNLLQDCFPEYTGKHDYAEYKNYIVAKYTERMSGKHVKIQKCILSATLKTDVENSFKAVQESIIELNQNDIEMAQKEIQNLEPPQEIFVKVNSNIPKS